MNKNSVINVLGNPINISIIGDSQFISLTDMAANNGGNDKIQQWIRNKDTVEFLGVWEQLYNPKFNSVEFHRIMYDAGVARFTISISQWIARTGAVGLQSKAGRYGATLAHKDLAFEFGTYLSPIFKLALIKEFQRLQEQEAKQLGGQWDFRRYVSKVNYKIQTDTIKEVLVPIKNVPKEQERFIYAEEADLIYIAMFGITSKQWREKFPQHAANGLNIRDVANSHQLIVLANLESSNSLLINAGHTDPKERLIILRKQSISDLKSLKSSNELVHELVISPNSLQNPLNQKKNENSTFDNHLKGLLNVPPPKKDK